MKTNSKLLIGLPVVVLLLVALGIRMAGGYTGTAIIPTTGHTVSQTGRVPAFSIITIKGRAFSAQKTEAIEENTSFTSVPAGKQKVALFSTAYKIISRGFVSEK
jgi:hypothetical protein